MSAAADREIADLDAALAADGQWIVLRRITGTQNQVNNDVRVRAFVRTLRVDELINGMIQSESLAIFSPTEINAAHWPGGQPPSAQAHPEIPLEGDKLIIAGKSRNVEFVNPIFLDDALIRIEVRTLG